jgi:hypothetical protein
VKYTQAITFSVSLYQNSYTFSLIPIHYLAFQAELNDEIEEMERNKETRPKSGSRASFRGSDAESDDDDDDSHGGLSGRAGSVTGGHRRGGGGGGGGVSYEEFNV